MILKPGMKHQGEDLDLSYSKVNIGRPCIRIGKIVKMSFEGKNFMEMGKWTEYL